MSDLRPLDRLRSIKVKLGLLVVASCAAASLTTWYGLVVLGWWPRYTLPAAVLFALGVTQLLADVWGYGDGSGARTIDSHVRSIRRKLGDSIVRTVHGVGYALDEPRSA